MITVLHAIAAGIITYAVLGFFFNISAIFVKHQLPLLEKAIDKPVQIALGIMILATMIVGVVSSLLISWQVGSIVFEAINR